MFSGLLYKRKRDLYTRYVAGPFAINVWRAPREFDFEWIGWKR